MGLFSRISRKRDAVVDEDEVLARLSANSELQRQRAHDERQRDIARATALKIDAIEAAMAADIFNDAEPPFRRPPRVDPPPAATESSPVTEILADDEPADTAVVDEAALLYANGDDDAAERLLAAAVRDDRRPARLRDRTVWWLLFDLYQVLGRQEAFDDLAIDYASTFETSPPSWQPPVRSDPYTGVTPTVQFAGVLDTGAAPQAEQLRELAGAPVLRLDFSRVHAVSPPGCALLLAALQTVPAQRELILVGADELVALLQATVEVGRRDDGEAPWLLLLELLRLLNRDKAFEETAMDYCVTFEMSPPSFVAPGHVASAPRQAGAPAGDRFMLPHVIVGDIGPLLAAIRDYAGNSAAVVFDCSHLVRIDTGAADQLLACLRELAADGSRPVAFRDLNHLVAALLRRLGFGGMARLVPHRY
jgi:anti-anti-sigma regulatory factor